MTNDAGLSDPDICCATNFTISKFDKSDPETNRPESGQVRFYAKWRDENGPYVGIEPSYLEVSTQ